MPPPFCPFPDPAAVTLSLTASLLIQSELEKDTQKGPDLQAVRVEQERVKMRQKEGHYTVHHYTNVLLPWRCQMEQEGGKGIKRKEEGEGGKGVHSD